MAQEIQWTNSKINWRSRIVKYGKIRADQVLAHPLNPRKHPIAQRQAVQASFDVLGQISPIMININNNYLVDGEDRTWLALAQGDDTEIDAVWVDLSEKEHAIALTTFDWITQMAYYDKDNLSSLLQSIDTNNEALQTLLDDLVEKNNISLDDDEPLEDETIPESDDVEFTRGDVPDALWPTDNDYDIPLLDLTMQSDAVDLPLQIWGSTKRNARMPGTWAFYTDDYRYEALWDDPTPIMNTRCINAIEPNFSCYGQMPMAVGLWAIYRKRWLARYWQSKGIRVFVDLNVNEKFYDLNMMGVPVGWKAFATRGYSERIAQTDREYTMACERAGTSSILFVVYGGGKAVKAHCQSKGYIWFDEVMNYG